MGKRRMREMNERQGGRQREGEGAGGPSSYLRKMVPFLPLQNQQVNTRDERREPSNIVTNLLP